MFEKMQQIRSPQLFTKEEMMEDDIVFIYLPLSLSLSPSQTLCPFPLSSLCLALSLSLSLHSMLTSLYQRQTDTGTRRTILFLSPIVLPCWASCHGVQTQTVPEAYPNQRVRLQQRPDREMGEGQPVMLWPRFRKIDILTITSIALVVVLYNSLVCLSLPFSYVLITCYIILCIIFELFDICKIQQAILS